MTNTDRETKERNDKSWMVNWSYYSSGIMSSYIQLKIEHRIETGN